MEKGKPKGRNGFGLQSGRPCRKHQCSQCCIHTRMPLTPRDIHEIVGMGFNPPEFMVRAEGEWRLRNEGTRGQCVFLKGGKCRIYRTRPTGCRIYPLVFNETFQRAMIDALCPFGSEFQVTDTDRETLSALIQQLNKEHT